MTKKQIDKELERQAVLFEEKCRNGTFLDGNIKPSEFVEKWLVDYTNKQLKDRTIAEYKRLCERIIMVLEHLRMDRIQPHHLIGFYNNLAEEGIRKDLKYKATNDFTEYLKAKHITSIELANSAGISRNTVMCCRQGKNVSADTATKIMKALNNNSLFTIVSEKKILSTTSIVKYHTLLSSIFSTAIQWQTVISNSCDRVSPPKKERYEGRYLDEVEAAELMKCLGKEPLQYKTIVMLLLYSGMRRGELCGLEWSDINFKNSLISITKSSAYLPQKGIFDDTTKNKSSERGYKGSRRNDILVEGT